MFLWIDLATRKGHPLGKSQSGDRGNGVMQPWGDWKNRIIMGLLNSHYCGIIMGLLLCTMINLVGGVEHFLFFQNIRNNSSQLTDFHIFQRDRYTTLSSYKVKCHSSHRAQQSELEDCRALLTGSLYGHGTSQKRYMWAPNRACHNLPSQRTIHHYIYMSIYIYCNYIWHIYI